MLIFKLFERDILEFATQQVSPATANFPTIYIKFLFWFVPYCGEKMRINYLFKREKKITCHEYWYIPIHWYILNSLLKWRIGKLADESHMYCNGKRNLIVLK